MKFRIETNFQDANGYLREASAENPAEYLWRKNDKQPKPGRRWKPLDEEAQKALEDAHGVRVPLARAVEPQDEAPSFPAQLSLKEAVVELAGGPGEALAAEGGKRGRKSRDL